MSFVSFKQLCVATDVMLRNQLPNNKFENKESVATITKTVSEDNRTDIDSDLLDINIIHNPVEDKVSVSTILNCGSYKLFGLACFRLKSTALISTKIQHALAITMRMNLTTRSSHHLKTKKKAAAMTLQSRKIYFYVKPVKWLSEKSIDWKRTNGLTLA